MLIISPLPVVILVQLNQKLLCRDSNGYLGAHDLAVVYRSLGENLEDDLVHPVLRCANDSSLFQQRFLACG